MSEDHVVVNLEHINRSIRELRTSVTILWISHLILMLLLIIAVVRGNQ